MTTAVGFAACQIWCDVIADEIGAAGRDANGHADVDVRSDLDLWREVLPVATCFYSRHVQCCY
jgi:hypothetical protein